MDLRTIGGRPTAPGTEGASRGQPLGGRPHIERATAGERHGGHLERATFVPMVRRAPRTGQPLGRGTWTLRIIGGSPTAMVRRATAGGGTWSLRTVGGMPTTDTSRFSTTIGVACGCWQIAASLQTVGMLLGSVSWVLGLLPFSTFALNLPIGLQRHEIDYRYRFLSFSKLAKFRVAQFGVVLLSQGVCHSLHFV